MLTKFKLSGLTCPACQKLSQNRIGKISGVTDIKVDLKSGEAEINADRTISKDEVVEVLHGTPYEII